MVGQDKGLAIFFGGAHVATRCMKPHLRQRRCRHCKALFHPDPRNRHHQHFCSAAGCQRVRKATNQRDWSRRPANRDYWRGAQNTERVRQWRKAHPGYWKRGRGKRRGTLQDVCLSQPPASQGVKPELLEGALQDVWPIQHPLVVGLISLFTGSTLQADIAETGRRLVARGHDILGMVPRSVNQTPKPHDDQTTPGAGTTAPNPRPVQLGRSTVGARPPPAPL